MRECPPLLDGEAYMRRERPSPQCCSCDCPQKASPPVGRKTCDPSGSPKPRHAECTRTGPNLQTHMALGSFALICFFFFLNEKYWVTGINRHNHSIILCCTQSNYITLNLCYRARCGLSRFLQGSHLSPGETGQGCPAGTLHPCADGDIRSSSHHTG